MSLTTRHLFVFLLLSLTFLRSQSAQWEKLKKCSDLSFCRRQRNYQSKPDDAYSIAPDSLSVVVKEKVSTVEGNLQRLSASEPDLLFSLRAIDPGIFHLSLTSFKPELHKRYQVKDVIVQDVKFYSFSSNEFKKLDNYAILEINKKAVKITYRPFKVELLDVTSGKSETLVSFNAESRLLFELLREKPTPAPTSTPTTSVASESLDVANQVAEGAETNNPQSESEVEEDSILKEPVKEPEPEGWGETFQSHFDPQSRGPESVGADITFPFATAAHGIPERAVSLSIPPTVESNNSAISEPYRLYNLDVFEFELDKPLGLYGAIPLLIGRKAEKSAAVLWLNSAETYVDLDTKTEGGVRSHWYSESGIVDLYLLSGPTPTDVFDQYRVLTGPPAMPQRFALGYHQCRWNYRDEPDVRAVDAGLEQHGIPYDVIWLDIEHTDGKRYFTWDYERFPEPSKLQNDLAVRGRRMVTIIDPHTKRDDKYALHKLATKNNYYVMNEHGEPYDGWCWPGSSSYLDFLSPVVRSAWASRFNSKDYPHFTEHLYTWVDMNEPSVFNGPEGTMPKHMIHDGGIEHRHVHNLYGLNVQRATFEGLLKGHGGNDRPFVLSRSFFAGSQRYGAIWTGDNTADWKHLASSVSMLLPLQMTGMVFSGADVGGFFGDVDAELLTRWYQIGAFQPFFRAHGHLDTKRREPWLFGDETTKRIATAIRTRYTYLPLWYTLFAGNALANVLPFSADTRNPPMRPLWWEFPKDAEAEKQETSWLVGSALLIAPVMEQGANTKRVYLPKDELWYDLFNPMEPGAMVTGGRFLNINTPMDRMIAFQRGGSIIPKQSRRRRSTVAMAVDPYTLVLALNTNGEAFGELYMDDGKSYDYNSGAFTLMKFTYSHKGGLEATVASGGQKEFLGWKNGIERIEIHGVDPNSLKSATVEGSGRTVEVESLGSRSILVRKPLVEMGTDWRLVFTVS